MPGLISGALERDVETNLDDLILGPEHGLTHADQPWMCGQLDESAECLRMCLYIPSPWPAPYGAAGSLNRFPERGHHVLAHRSTSPRERTFERK